MKKILNALLILTSLIGYLEWADNHSFIYQVEIDLLFNFSKKQNAFTHPLILLPLLGQFILLITLFQKQPSKALTLIGLGCLSSIMLLLFIIGFLSKSAAIILYSSPFIVAGGLTLWYTSKKSRDT